MCGRYYFTDKTAYEVEEELGLSHGSLKNGAGDITPGMPAPGIIWNRADTAKPEIAYLFWGIKSFDKKLIINARAESAGEKRMFSESIEKRRCILPAAGFYEWDKNKTKFRFYREDKNPIYLAGIYDLSENMNSFVILTTSANGSMAPVHDRMPVIIDKKDVSTYLGDTRSALEMIKLPVRELSKSSDYEQLSLF